MINSATAIVSRGSKSASGFGLMPFMSKKAWIGIALRSSSMGSLLRGSTPPTIARTAGGVKVGLALVVLVGILAERQRPIGLSRRALRLGGLLERFHRMN